MSAFFFFFFILCFSPSSPTMGEAAKNWRASPLPHSVLSPLAAFGGRCWDSLGSPRGLGGQEKSSLGFLEGGWLAPSLTPFPAGSPVSGEGLGFMCSVFM